MMNSNKKMKMIVPRDGVQQKVRSFFPEKLIFETIMRLPARSIGKFRSLSKLSLSITTTTSFIAAHIQRNRFTRQSIIIIFKRYENSSQSLIITDKNYKKQRSVFFLPSIDTNSDAGITLHEQPHVKLFDKGFMHSSCDGLILYFKNSLKKFFIIDPKTGQSLLLPELEDFCDYYVFYFHPSTSTYRIFASSYDKMIDNILVVGKTHWRQIHVRRPAFTRGTYSLEANQSLHWLAWKDKNDVFTFKPPHTIITFDIEAEVYGLLPLPPLKDLDGRGGKLMNFNGEFGLWAIDDYGIIDLWIMKECWIKWYSIKHPDLEGIIKLLKPTKHELWNLGIAVSNKDEELLIGIKGFGFLKLQYLVHWNLMSGVCLVKKFENIGLFSNNFFPYTETLASLDHLF